MDAAIVHASKIVPVSRIPDEQREVALDLIYDRRREDYDPLQRFLEMFENVNAADAKATRAQELAAMPLSPRLQQRIIDGERVGLEADLDEALLSRPALEIVNDTLLEGMKVVGELFGRGEMQLPFVLQSAEVMKRAVAHLEPHMEKSDEGGKGTIVLATVKGDVHDIGKNLVDIILSNNGYSVVNLGIKQPVSAIIDAAEENSADVIGMSGLLVKSTVVMKENLAEISSRGHAEIVAGAPRRCGPDPGLRRAGPRRAVRGHGSLRPRRVRGSAADGHHDGREARRARSCLAAASPAPRCRRPRIGRAGRGEHRTLGRRRRRRARSRRRRSWVTGWSRASSWPITPTCSTRRPPSRVVGDCAASRAARPTTISSRPRDGRGCASGSTACRPRAGWTPAWSTATTLAVSEGNDLVVLNDDGSDRIRFTFPRQRRDQRLCLADFFRPRVEWRGGRRRLPGGDRRPEDQRGDRRVVRRERLPRLPGAARAFGSARRGAGRVLAPAGREELGFVAEEGTDVRDVLEHQAYRGSRYSFGYPACPDLEDRAKVIGLVHPERLGVTLSEEFQLHPEQSTDAIIVHHPQAKYFSA